MIVLRWKIENFKRKRKKKEKLAHCHFVVYWGTKLPLTVFLELFIWISYILSNFRKLHNCSEAHIGSDIVVGAIAAERFSLFQNPRRAYAEDLLVRLVTCLSRSVRPVLLHYTFYQIMWCLAVLQRQLLRACSPVPRLRECKRKVSPLNLPGNLISRDPTSRDLETNSCSPLKLEEQFTSRDLCANSVSLPKFGDGASINENKQKQITAATVSGTSPGLRRRERQQK